MLPDTLSVLINVVVSIGAGAATAFAFFRWLGKKWLENRFAKNLEQFKHEQAQEIERLRYRINALMDRTSKLHQHEFEVLPEVWDKLSIAMAEVTSFTSRIQTYPDLDSMREMQFSEFLENCELHEWEKKELSVSQSRTSTYAELIFWHRLRRVKIAHAGFHNTFIAKGIFIQPELKEKIRSVSDMMYDAFRERELDKQLDEHGPDRFKKADLLREEGQTRLREIEKSVQSRLWEANKLD